MRRTGTIWLVGYAIIALAASGCSRRTEEVEVSHRRLTMGEWAPGVSYVVGALATFNGITFRCRQAHTSQAGWEPPKVPALWERPGAAGINPWANQIAYVVGSGVSFDGLVYRCIQGQAVDVERALRIDDRNRLAQGIAVAAGWPDHERVRRDRSALPGDHHPGERGCPLETHVQLSFARGHAGADRLGVVRVADPDGEGPGHQPIDGERSSGAGDRATCVQQLPQRPGDPHVRCLPGRPYDHAGHGLAIRPGQDPPDGGVPALEREPQASFVRACRQQDAGLRWPFDRRPGLAERSRSDRKRAGKERAQREYAVSPAPGLATRVHPRQGSFYDDGHAAGRRAVVPDDPARDGRAGLDSYSDLLPGAGGQRRGPAPPPAPPHVRP
jgi:hypothetical protein